MRQHSFVRRIAYTAASTIAVCMLVSGNIVANAADIPETQTTNAQTPQPSSQTPDSSAQKQETGITPNPQAPITAKAPETQNPAQQSGQTSSPSDPSAPQANPGAQTTFFRDLIDKAYDFVEEHKNDNPNMYRAEMWAAFQQSVATVETLHDMDDATATANGYDQSTFNAPYYVTVNGNFYHMEDGDNTLLRPIPGWSSGEKSKTDVMALVAQYSQLKSSQTPGCYGTVQAWNALKNEIDSAKQMDATGTTPSTGWTGEYKQLLIYRDDLTLAISLYADFCGQYQCTTIDDWEKMNALYSEQSRHLSDNPADYTQLSWLLFKMDMNQLYGSIEPDAGPTGWTDWFNDHLNRIPTELKHAKAGEPNGASPGKTREELQQLIDSCSTLKESDYSDGWQDFADALNMAKSRVAPLPPDTTLDPAYFTISYWQLTQARDALTLAADPASVSTIDLTWIVRSEDIAVGAAVNSPVHNLEYKWQSYNLSTHVWHNITNWYAGNWAGWSAETGDYWLHLEVREAGSHRSLGSKTIAFHYTPGYAAITGTYSGYRSDGILLGMSSNDPQGKYVEKIYDYNAKRWVAQFNGQWSVWHPTPGVYWTHYELYTSDGRLADTRTYAFGV
ncbi:hypothetical protein PT282_00905 [Bifidobacterium sp. ESL0763]|uniref:hypothetical protein n=1 Tax=Bifidobacterium sp. ESL0763 TaxID=2983227 RepID=UPI0023F7B701|nr:hypothetical protein [Bifidobacterium sp. ESL0763]MDF7663241.1 hypothetical protein [Bifidobacterium sp. ESL0763]